MAERKPVERHSGVALWRQIADRIRVSITDGEFGGRGMLPPETALAARFGVNRHTVRSAIAFLAEEGLVEPIQGHGTVILDRRKLSFPISRRTRFSAGLIDQAETVETRILSSAPGAAEGEAAELLKLAPSTPVIQIEEMGLADGRPLCCALHVFPAARFPGIAGHIRDLGSITRAFAAEGLADYLRAATDVSARHADARERELLKLSPGAIVLEARAVNVDPDGVPVQCSWTRFAADRISLRIAL